MKVTREVKMNVSQFEIGDRIKVKFAIETHTATAYKQESDGMLFVMDECLNEQRPMNEDNTNKGGFDKSDLRKYLQKKAMELPKKFRNKMVPFENGDVFCLLRLAEIIGENNNQDTICEPLDFFKNRKHQIAFCKETGNWSWYWLEDPVVMTQAIFAGCYLDGHAYYDYAGNARGVRPVFKLQNLKTEDL